MPLETTSPPVSRDVEIILHGHPYRAIIRLAWPATLSMLLHTLFSVVNAIWVGRLGAESVAGVISATFVVWILYSLVSVLSTGIVAMISRALGSGDIDRARAIGEESGRFAFFFAVGITLFGVLLRRPIIGVMHLEPGVARLAEEYLAVYFLGALFIVVVESVGAVFRASGNTRTPLVVIGAGLICNIVLDPLLIFGVGPFPRWESTGAAAATVISYGLTTLLLLYFVRFGRLPFRFRLSVWGPMDWRRIGRLLLIGIPISISGIVFSVVYLFVNRITATFGTEAVATLGIGNRIESINYLMSFGLATAVATLVGQNLGAQNPARAGELTRKTLLLVSIFTGFTTIVFLLFPEAIMRVFVDDPAVIAIGKNYVRILGLSQMLMGWEIVFEGAFSGAGDTLPPMLVAIPGAVLRIPLAWFLASALNMGPDGIWWTITISTFLKGIVLYFWFSLGRWKTRRVA